MTEAGVSSSPAVFAQGPAWKACPLHPPSQPAPAPKGPQASRDAPAAQAVVPGRPPRGAFSEAVRVSQWGSHTTTLQPRHLAGPPARPAPRPGTSSWPRPPPHCLQPSSSETASEAVYASFAAAARRMSAWRRDGSGHQEWPGRLGGGERPGGRPAGLGCSGRQRRPPGCRSGRGGAGRTNQPLRPAPLSLRRLEATSSNSDPRRPAAPPS